MAWNLVIGMLIKCRMDCEQEAQFLGREGVRRSPFMYLGDGVNDNNEHPIGMRRKAEGEILGAGHCRVQ